MEKKKVYLFELDSVRNSDEEIILAQKTLFEEIVVNGNIVVMTFNQIVDSRGFFSLFQNDAYRDNIQALFEKGAIQISQFGDTKTLCQYLINSLDSDRTFIYSTLPLKSTQKHLLALLKRSLIYSDLSELYEYVDDENENKVSKKKEDDYKHLFKEYEQNGKHYKHKDTTLDLSEMKEIMHNLYHLIEAVLELSPLQQIYTYPKNKDAYIKYNFSFYIDKITSLDMKDVFQTDKEYKAYQKAIQILKESKKLKNNNRSDVLKELRVNNKNTNNEFKQSYQLAEIITNLAYNYACEASIRNISKHYDFSDLELNDLNNTSFHEDVIQRFKQVYNDGKDADNKFLQEETNEFNEFIPNKKDIPNFARAVNFLECENYTYKDVKEPTPRYEYNLSQQQKEHKDRIKKGSKGKWLWLFGYFVIALVIEIGLNALQDLIKGRFPESNPVIGVLASAVSIILTIFASEGISLLLGLINKNVPALSDVLHSIRISISDRIALWGLKSHTYHTNLNTPNDQTETYNDGTPIGNVYSKEMKNYIKLKNNPEYAELFEKPNEVYPLPNLDEVKDKIIDYEEVSNKPLGLVYTSGYHHFIVDPILQINDEDKPIQPYDRVITNNPKTKNGVVILAKCDGKFLFLKQFRHAFRKELLALPRGFSEIEDNNDPTISGIRELNEEVSVVKKGEALTLGKVAPDSGLTNVCANVIYIELESYSKKETEGIKEVIALSEEEIEEYISNGKLYDGFSLAAYSLYKSKVGKQS